MAFSKRFIKCCIIIVTLLFLTISFSYGQRLTGTISGVVQDEEGIPLPGATVQISSPALMGGPHSQMTTDKGVFRFSNLPPGTYKLIFTLEGFQTFERENLRVSAGATTTENITLNLAAIEESVTVIAASPVVDVTKSSTTVNFNQDQLTKLPTGRASFFDIVKQVPGFVTTGGEVSSRISAYGSNSEENATYMDGVDLSSPELGTAWLWQTADMFEEVSVSGIGTPAEYGNFTGAVINIVTKSGGNTLSGSASYYGQFQALTDDNNPDPDMWTSFNRDKFNHLIFTLGGPVIKDRLWFFGLFKSALESFSNWQEDPENPVDVNRPEFFLKISSQIADRHRLVFSYNYQYSHYAEAPDQYNLPETICAEIGVTHGWNILYTFLISNDSYLDLKYSGYYSPMDWMPIHGGDINQFYHYDGATGISSGAPFWPWEYIVSRNQANASFTHFADDFLAGDHEFKVGVQYNRGSTECWGGYERWYYDYSYNGIVYPYLMYEYGINRYGGVINNVGVFIDDSWKVSDRLAVNIGVRFDYHNASIPAFPIMDGWTETSQKGPAIDNLIVWNSFSPRIGLAYQLTSDRKTLLKLSFGRYYNYPYIANWEYPGPNVPDWKAYLRTGNEWELWREVPGEMGYRVDPDLKNPYADQISIGLEREIFPDFSVDATFIYKSQKNTIGYINQAGVYEQVKRTSPDNGKTYTVWNQTNPGEEDHLLTNPDDWGQTYRGLILNINKRYSNNWLLNASLTWSKAEGLNLSSHSPSGYATSQSLVWVTGKFGTDPNDLINTKGYLNLDRRWIIKISAAYNFPWDILASLNFTYQTGRPKLTFVRIYDLDQQPESYLRIISEERGTERFDPMAMLDFRLQKTFKIYRTLRASLFVDAFNLLNADVYTDYRSYELWHVNYEVPYRMPWPRRLQIGAKIEF